MHPYFKPPTPHLFGHRGASGVCPENTLVAFESAREAGVRFLEMDCHATRDGEVVICHDARVDQTTDATGAICEYHWKDLAQLDAGYRFTPDGESFPFRGRGVRIPRLDEVLERFPDAHINLEVKQADPPITERVVDVLREHDAIERTLLAAEQEEVLSSIRALQPGTALGSSLADALAFYTARAEGRLDGFRPAGHALQVPPSFQGDPLCSREIVEDAHAVGLLVHVWTVNEPEEIRRLLDCGADGLMSDFPDRLVRVAAERESGG